MITRLCVDGDSGSLAFIVSAGAIPPLVQLLGPGASDDVQMAAAGALVNLAGNDNQFTIADAGAIPLLVQLLGAGSADLGTNFAASALMALGHNNAKNGAAIAVACASADVGVLEALERLGVHNDE
ncbi:hypothetical protein FOA52_013497 [Chlamydomonas sp. UWO 241]|nr:hypothetical protein FOA52_013497 [Chlamydomonas sp. UWO 241]